MPETNIGSASISGLTSRYASQADAAVSQTFKIASQTTDAAGDQKEYTWQSPTWPQNFGYYNSVPELKTAVNTKATWTIGAGFEADEPTTLLLDTIKGNGKDTFTSIIKNTIKVKTLDGDSYAEIIRDDDEVLANLKPLDPSSIVIVQNNKGRIIRYEQTSKIKGKPNKPFKPEQIFHLSKERMADEIHGTGIIPSVEWIILARNEAMADWKRVLHRNIEPLWIFHLDTDDTTQIAAFKAKMDSARVTGENMYIPKGAVVPELVTTAANASLNPLAWINQLNDYFFQAVNCPQIIIGNAKEFTDASGKIVYLSYEQSVKAEQLYIEEQILSQLNLQVALTFPASLQSEMISDQPNMELEEEPIEKAAQPNDMTSEMEGKK